MVALLKNIRQSENFLEASPFASLRARPELAEAKDEKFLAGKFRAVLREQAKPGPAKRITYVYELTVYLIFSLSPALNCDKISKLY